MTNTHKESTSDGDLEITPIFHGSIHMKFRGKDIHIDPWSRGDYSSYDKADLILITHNHADHLDVDLIKKLEKPDTQIIANVTSQEALADFKCTILKNGENTEVEGITIDAIPAYNIVRERSPGVKLHPKGEGNGYIMQFGDKRVYVSGDTEATPEIEELKDIDIAFVPIRLPYTMSPDEAATVVKKFRPKIVFAYHTGGDPTPQEFMDQLASENDIEIRG